MRRPWAASFSASAAICNSRVWTPSVLRHVPGWNFFFKTLDFGSTTARLLEMAQKSSPPDTAVYTLRIDRDKLERFHVVAEAEYRTVAQKIRQLIDECIAPGEQEAT